jgi:Sulfotransferase family
VTTEVTGRDVAGVEQLLHEEASAIAGSDDFGPDDYREGLSRVLFDLDRVTGGGEALEVAARFRTLAPLVGRLYSQRGWSERPDVLGGSITAPVMITGIPRTGTTLMHKLLSMHQDFQVLQNWLIAYPMVRPPRDTWEDHREYQAAVGAVASQPEYQHVTHFVAPDEADECLGLVSQSFVTVSFGAATSLPRYDEWMLAQDPTPSLRRHSDNLRLIGADDSEKRWLLKNPSSILCMRGLFAVYPDVRVIWMHRDPQQAIGSLVDMMSSITGWDPSDVAARELRLWSEGAHRSEETRVEHRESFFDVDYARLVSDPITVSTEVLSWLGMDMGAEMESRLESWLDENPQGKHGVHRYTPEAMGVTREIVGSMFGPYMQRYDPSTRS